MENTDLKQYRAQTRNILELANEQLMFIRRSVAIYVDVDNENFKPHRMHWIGSKIQDAGNAIEEIKKRAEQINKTPWSESMAAAIYAKAVNAYNEIIEAVKSINSLTK